MEVKKRLSTTLTCVPEFKVSVNPVMHKNYKHKKVNGSLYCNESEEYFIYMNLPFISFKYKQEYLKIEDWGVLCIIY